MRTKRGVITSTKMDKTVVVSVYTYESDSKYKKRFRVTNKFFAHDEKNLCNEWDTVTIKETRPTSKNKRWEVVEGK